MHPKTVQNPKYACEQCNFKTDLKQQLDRHCQRRHNGLYIQSNGRFQCAVCPFSTSSDIALTCHVKREHPETLVKCDKCKFSAASEEGLRQHYDQKHKGARPVYKCHLCISSFKRFYKLKQHVKECIRELLVCPACDQQFSSQASRKQHITHHHMDNGMFHCRTCQAMFHTVDQLADRAKVCTLHYGKGKSRVKGTWGFFVHSARKLSKIGKQCMSTCRHVCMVIDHHRIVVEVGMGMGVKMMTMQMME